MLQIRIASHSINTGKIDYSRSNKILLECDTCDIIKQSCFFLLKNTLKIVRSITPLGVIGGGGWSKKYSY